MDALTAQINRKEYSLAYFANSPPEKVYTIIDASKYSKYKMIHLEDAETYLFQCPSSPQ